MENFVSKELNENPGGLVYFEPRNYRRIPTLITGFKRRGVTLTLTIQIYTL